MDALPLIVGGGPVGLAAGLFLSQQKTHVRLIERLTERSKYSKALAVNPRTLELLESTGVTARMLAIGKKIHGTIIWGQGKPIATMNLADLHHKYPFMLALSQGTSERLLEEAFVEAGGYVERGTELVSCRTLIGKAEATLQATGGGNDEVVQAPWLFASDGAKSTVRQAMKIGFKGSTFQNEWSLADVPMEIDLAEDRAHIIFLPSGGFLFVMRVVGDGVAALSRPLWRVMGNVFDPVARLSEQHALQADAPTWTSTFRISHRIASNLQIDKICLGGDAAHIHSPAGARGMNLGIEDAWEFSQRLMRGSIVGYGKSRLPIDRSVVKRIGLMTRLMMGESIATRAARSIVMPVASDIRTLRMKFMLTMTGLDHALPVG